MTAYARLPPGSYGTTAFITTGTFPWAQTESEGHPSHPLSSGHLRPYFTCRAPAPLSSSFTYGGYRYLKTAIKAPSDSNSSFPPEPVSRPSPFRVPSRVMVPHSPPPASTVGIWCRRDGTGWITGPVDHSPPGHSDDYAARGSGHLTCFGQRYVLDITSRIQGHEILQFCVFLPLLYCRGAYAETMGMKETVLITESLRDRCPGELFTLGKK